jgi:hypothetical protein
VSARKADTLGRTISEKGTGTAFKSTLSSPGLWGDARIADEPLLLTPLGGMVTSLQKSGGGRDKKAYYAADAKRLDATQKSSMDLGYGKPRGAGSRQIKGADDRVYSRAKAARVFGHPDGEEDQEPSSVAGEEVDLEEVMAVAIQAALAAADAALAACMLPIPLCRYTVPPCHHD